MGLQRFPYKKFTGLNLRDAPFLLDPSESGDETNVQPIDPIEFRGLKERAGFVTVNYTGLPTAKITEFFYWPSKNLFMLVSQGDIWVAPSTSPGAAATKKHDSTDTTTRWKFAIGLEAGVEKIWAIDTSGLYATQKWDGGAGNFVVGTWAPEPAFGTGVTASIVNWRGRLVIGPTSDSNVRIRFSDTGDGELPAVANWGNNFADFHDNDPMPGITGLLIHRDQLLVFKERRVWQVYDPNSFGSRVIATPGCQSGMVISHPNGRFYWYSSESSKVYSGNLNGQVVSESEKINIFFQTNFPYETPVLADDQSILWPCTNNYIMQFYPGKPGDGAWFRHLLPFTPGAVGLGASGSGFSQPDAVYITDGGTTVAQIYKLFSGTSDNATAIGGYWMSSWRPFISEEPLERLRRFHPIYGGAPVFDIYAEMSPIQSPSPKSTHTPTEISPVDNRNFPTHRPESRGRYHAFKIRNSGAANKPFEVDELEFVFRGGKEHN